MKLRILFLSLFLLIGSAFAMDAPNQDDTNRSQLSKLQKHSKGKDKVPTINQRENKSTSVRQYGNVQIYPGPTYYKRYYSNGELCDYHCKSLNTCFCAQFGPHCRGKRKSLYEFFGLKQIKELPNELKQMIVLDYMNSHMPDGWWYQANEFKGFIAASFNPTGDKILALPSDSTLVKLLDLQGKILQKFDHGHAPVSTISMNKNGDKVVTSSLDGVVKLWDINGNKLVEFRTDPGLNSVVLSADDNRFLVALQDGTAKILDIYGNLLTSFNHRGAIWSAVFNHRNDLALTASSDKTVKVWSLSTNDEWGTLQHNAPVLSAVFSRDDILTVSYDGIAHLWDIHGHELKQYRHPNGKIISAQFNPKGDKIITAADDGTGQVRDRNGHILKIFRLPGKDSKVCDITINASDDHVVTMSKGGKIELWNRYKNPTLEQLLLRATIEKYLTTKKPKKSCMQPFRVDNLHIANPSPATLLPLIAKQFEVDPYALKEVWYSLDPKIQKDLWSKIQASVNKYGKNSTLGEKYPCLQEYWDVFNMLLNPFSS